MKTTITNIKKMVMKQFRFGTSTATSPKKKPAALSITVLMLMLMCLGAGKGWGQTNPTAQSLPYTQNFGTASFSAMPTGMAAWTGGANRTSQSAAENGTPGADASVTAASATQTSGNIYGYATSSNARAYIQESSNATNGTNTIVAAINTGTATSITVAYQLELINGGVTTQDYGLALQYRSGTTGSWTTISGSALTFGAVTTYTTTTLSYTLTGLSTSTVYQIRWITWRPSGSGPSKGVGIDNISITATATTTNYYSKSSGNLNDTATWGTSTDGSGTAPTNFTTANQVFNIRNNAAPTIAAAWTVSGTNSKIIVGDGNACNFTIPSGFAAAGTIDVSSNGTLTNQNTTSPTFGTLNGTIIYDGSSAQTIPAGTYSNLTIKNNAATKTLGGNITLNAISTLTLDAGVTLDANIRTITFGATGFANINGTLQTSNTNGFSGGTLTTIVSTNNPTINLGTSSTIVYNSGTAQAVTGRAYANLQISNTGATKTAGANITLENSNTFTLDAGVNYDAGTSTMAFGTSGIATINGIFKTANTSSGGFSGSTLSSITSTNSPSITLGSGSTVEYTSASTQTVTTAQTYYNLLISGITGIKSINPNPAIAAGGTFTINLNCTVDMNTTSMNFGAGCNAVINGTLQTQASAGFSGTGSTAINSNNSPTITLGSGSTIEYNRTGSTSNQTITARDYRNVIFSGSAAMNLAGNITVQGGSTLTVSNNLVCGTNIISQSGSGSTNISVTGTISTSNPDGFNGSATTTINSANTSITLSTASTVNYASATAQIITAGNYGSITNTGNGTRTLASSGIIDINNGFTPTTNTTTITGSTIKYSSIAASRFTLSSFTTNIPNRQYNNLILEGGLTTEWQLGSGYNLGVAGNFSGTGSGLLYICPNTTANTVTVDGNFEMSGAFYVYIANFSGTGTLNVTGNLTNTGTGILTGSFSSGAGNLNVSGNVTLSGSSPCGIKVTDDASAPNTIFTILGNLIIEGAATINLEVVSSTSGSSKVIVGGDFSATSTSTSIVDFGTGTVAGNEVTIAGNFSKTGTGKFTTTSSSASSGFVFNKVGSRTFFYSGASSQYTQYEVSIGSTLQLLSGLAMGSATNPLSKFTVNGTLDMGTLVISGTTDPTFTLAAGATLKTASTGGLVSAITVPGLKTFTAGANYEFNGDTTTAFPTAPQQASFGNPANITANANITLNRNITATGTVNLTDKIVNSTGNTLTLSGTVARTTGTIAGTGTTEFVGPSSIPSGLFSSNTNTVAGSLAINRAGGVSLSSDLTVTGGLALTSGSLVLGANTLALNGAVSGSGTLTGGATSNLTIGGAAGTLNFTSGARNLKNLTLGNSATATLGTALDIIAGITSGTVTVGTGATLASAGNLTLKSDALGTARVAPVLGTITGNVTVERYIPAKRAWRALTAPVNTTTSIQANWQNGGTGNSANGFDIWSPAGGNGLAAGGGSNSLLQYNNSTNAYTGITATTGNSSMMSGDKNKPFMAFVTGPYGDNNIASGAKATTLKATGTLLTGTKTYTTVANKYTFIGNPYASPLSLTAMLNNASNATASFEGNIWVWDANAPGSRNVGTYNLFNNGTYSNLTSNPAVASSTEIQSGQAFFVKSTDAASFSIQEAHKGSTFSNAVLRTAAPELLRVGLYKEISAEWSGRDGAMAVILADADVNQTPNKMANGTENVAFTKNGLLFASEHHLPLVASDVLNVRVWNTTAGANYKLKINTEQFTSGLTATLEDVFTNSRTPLTLDGTAVEYPFTVTAVAASTGNRFKIVFENSALGINNPKATGISILPNPVTSDTFQVNLGTLASGTYAYVISNALGQEVERGSINNAAQNSSCNVKFKNATAAGIYIIKVTGTDNTVFTAKLIKQ